MKTTSLNQVVVLALLVTSPLEAATRTWTGGAIGNNQWMNITNWGLTPPANGDSLFFPFSAGNKSSVNNLGVTNYGTLFFAGSDYTFSGGTIGLSGGITATNAGGTNTFVTPLLLRASQSINSGNFAGALQIAGGINLNGNQLLLDGFGDIRIAAPISGTGELIKRGFGDLILQSASTFSGTTYVALAHVYVRHPLALGDINFPIVATNLTRRVFLGTNIFVTNKPLLLGIQSELWGEGGTNGWAGPIALTGSDPFLRLDHGGTLRLSGAISGAGDWNVIGPGTAILDGPAANTASGTWNIRSGATVSLNQPPRLSSGHRYFIDEGSTVRLLASDQLSDGRSLFLGDGALDLNGFSDRIAFHTDGSTNFGRVLFGSSGTNALTFGSTSVTSIFSGTLSGAGDLVKIGGSTHILRGTNNSTGDTIINGSGGVLAVDGRIVGPTIVTNGMLTGTGRVAAVTINGANGVMDPGLGTNSTARLTVNAASSWLAGRVQLQLNGLTPATQHDQLQLDAAVAITNCALQVTLGFAPALGNSFVIVTNTGAGPIQGHFAGLPEGAVLGAGGTLLRISYLGGTGNDITLTVVSSVTTGITRTWSGAGGNSFWRNGADWVGGTRPAGGDGLYFPPGALRTLNTNDFPPLFVDSILFGATGYDVRGQGVTLLGGLTATNPSGVVIVRTPLTLGTNQSFTQTHPLGTINIPATIDLGPHQLTVNATGSVITSGSILGSGSLLKTGPGQLVVLGTNLITGTNFIEQGIYFVDGAIPNAQVGIGPNATLNGIGYVGRVHCFGTIAPAEAGGQGALTFGDDVRLATGSVARFKLESTGPGGFDQMVMTNAAGLFAISNATLVIEPTATLVTGSAFTIIDKAGAGDVIGTFNGLPEGATFTASGLLCAITYQGGDGNDVVVTVVGIPPTGVTRTWTGAGADAFWQTAANWTPGVPQAGDSLAFPFAQFVVLATNNFPAGTIFDSLRIASLHDLRGKAITLMGGVSNVGSAFLSMPLTLAGNQTFSSELGQLSVADLTVGGTLTLDGPGSHSLSGTMTGSGHVVVTGGATWVIGGTNNITGTNLIVDGELRVDGLVQGLVSTLPGTEVRGTGRIVALQAAGKIEPGEDAEDALTITGELRLTNTSVLSIFLEDAPPGLGYNQIAMVDPVNPVDLGNATLDLSVRPDTVGLGESFTIIDKAGSAPVLGTFANLPEGSLITSSNHLLRITYAGGTGNDVVLTVISTGPTGVTRTWTGGGGANTNWSNPTNWLGGIAPLAGDTLSFPTTGSFQTFNDFPPTMIFNQLRLGTGTTSLSLRGNEVPLLSGMVVTNASFSPFVITPIRLLKDQSIVVANGRVSLTKIFTDGHQLAFDGNGEASVTPISVNSVPFRGEISGAGSIVKRGSGTLEIPNGIGAAGWSAPITLTSSNAVINNSNTTPFRVTGLVTGSGGLTKLGPGTVTLEADNTYSGPTVIESGTLVVTNSHLTGPMLVNGSNSTLLAARQMGPVTSMGGLLGAGTLTTPAIVDVVGNLSLDADTRFNVDVNGAAPGTGHDQWRVSGNVSLGGAVLNLAIRTVPTVGSTYVIIRNDSASPTTGTFAGLPPGSQFVRGNSIWLITYAGGDGNDVALIVIGQTVLGRVWDGGGANSNWMTALNWVGDTVPASGVNLIFPTEAANRVNFNDFPPGTGFNSLNFTGVTNSSSLRYTVRGNALTITNGLVCESNANATTFGLPLTLAGPAPIHVDPGASITFTNGVNSGAFNLSLSGNLFTFNTPITSGGGLISSARVVQLRSNNTFGAASLISTGTVIIDTSGAFGIPARALTIDRDGALQLGNAANMANPLVLRGGLISSATNIWSGPTMVEGTNASLTAGGGPLIMEGVISGGGSLSLAGGFFGAEIILQAANTHAGIMRLASGTLHANGSGTGSELHILTNQTSLPTALAGTGTVSTVRAGGTISPGLITNTGILRVAGDLTLSNSAVLEIQVNGVGAGTGHDQLRVNRNVRLENAALQLLQPPAFLPNVTDTFIIVRHDGPNPVSGTFAGLPQGGFVTNIAVFQITYTGGDGNDIALVVTAQKGLVSQWTGNGGTTNWTDGGNWLSTLPPGPGDTLIFSNGIPNRIAHNDFSAGTTFARLSFAGFTSGQPFFLSGNPLALTHGIDGFFSGSNVISMPITMSAPQTFSNAFGLLALRGSITNNGHNLALTGGGTFDFLAPYSGAGGLNWTNDPFSSFGFLRLRTNNPYTGPTAFDGNIAVRVYHPGGLGGSSSGTFIGRNA